MSVPRKWKVVSSRPYRWGRHRMMKPNQVFTAKEEDIPAEFKLMIIALDATPVVPETTRKPKAAVVVNVPGEQPLTYRIKPRGDYFDILDSKGKKINEQNLSEKEATDMLKKLQA